MLMLTFVERSRVDDNDAKNLALSLGFEEDTFNDRGSSIRENGLAVFDFCDGMLLNDSISEENTVTNKRIDLVNEKCFGLQQ